MATPTTQTYDELQHAYDFFNERLFKGTLPPCLITLQREKRTYGYFCSERFVKRSGEITDEIAMNPAYFAIRSIASTLSTLVHEQVHLFQEHFGKPGRRRYHNVEWGTLMEERGLMPSDTGKPGGRRTGDCMTHYIIEGGPFDLACKDLLTEEFTLSWIDRFPPFVPALSSPEPPSGGEDLEDDFDDPTAVSVGVEIDTDDLDDLGIELPPEPTNKSNRIKYRCPRCQKLQVWGKPGLEGVLGCIPCKTALEPVG